MERKGGGLGKVINRHALLATMFFSSSCGQTSEQPNVPAATQTAAHERIDDSRLREADRDTANWLMYGRTYDDHRFSPLSQINEETVAKLGLVWSRELGTTRGLEATPLVGNGVIYTTGSWSVVHAIDAKTGDIRWTYDPEVPRDRALFICCDAVNRGVALYRGKVYVGTLDGGLIALDAQSGTPVWSVMTVDATRPYAITGYPRIAKGMVLIGNAGAEYGVRGYVSAYDAESGKMAWRVYTVPGDPSVSFESKAMEQAAKTWSGEWWTVGGGGTVWEGIVYDPALDLASLRAPGAKNKKCLKGWGREETRVTRRHILKSLCLMAVLYASAGVTAQRVTTNSNEPLALTNANIVNVRNGRITPNAMIVLRDGKIESIGSNAAPAGIKVVDLQGKYVLPGLIDAHTHAADLAAFRRALESGVTTARSAGVSNYADVGFHELVKKGAVVGPDVVSAGYHIRPQLASDAFLSDTQYSDLMVGVTTIERMRRAVQMNLSHGVDWIKILATERAGAADTDPRKQVYS